LAKPTTDKLSTLELYGGIRDRRYAFAALLVDKGGDPNATYTKTVPPRHAQGNINVAPGATPLMAAAGLGAPGAAMRRSRKPAIATIQSIS
jgi:hypothetical protein